MNAQLTTLWTRHRWLLTAFALALAVTLFFAARLVMFTLYWNDPAHRNTPIAGWMTLRYVAHSWQLDPEQIDAALGLPREDGRGRISLEQLALERGVPVQTLIDSLMAIATRQQPDE